MFGTIQLALLLTVACLNASGVPLNSDYVDDSKYEGKPECTSDDDSDETIYYPHPRSCSHYYECFQGVLTINQCLQGLHYNPLAIECDFPEKANCILSGWQEEKLSSRLQPNYFLLNDHKANEERTYTMTQNTKQINKAIVKTIQVEESTNKVITNNRNSNIILHENTTSSLPILSKTTAQTVKTTDKVKFSTTPKTKSFFEKFFAKDKVTTEAYNVKLIASDVTIKQDPKLEKLNTKERTMAPVYEPQMKNENAKTLMVTLNPALSSFRSITEGFSVIKKSNPIEISHKNTINKWDLHEEQENSIVTKMTDKAKAASNIIPTKTTHRPTTLLDGETENNLFLRTTLKSLRTDFIKPLGVTTQNLTAKQNDQFKSNDPNVYFSKYLDYSSNLITTEMSYTGDFNNLGLSTDNILQNSLHETNNTKNKTDIGLSTDSPKDIEHEPNVLKIYPTTGSKESHRSTSQNNLLLATYPTYVESVSSQPGQNLSENTSTKSFLAYPKFESSAKSEIFEKNIQSESNKLYIPIVQFSEEVINGNNINASSSLFRNRSNSQLLSLTNNEVSSTGLNSTVNSYDLNNVHLILGKPTDFELNTALVTRYNNNIDISQSNEANQLNESTILAEDERVNIKTTSKVFFKTSPILKLLKNDVNYLESDNGNVNSIISETITDSYHSTRSFILDQLISNHLMISDTEKHSNTKPLKVPKATTETIRVNYLEPTLESASEPLLAIYQNLDYSSITSPKKEEETTEQTYLLTTEALKTTPLPYKVSENPEMKYISQLPIKVTTEKRPHLVLTKSPTTPLPLITKPSIDLTQANPTHSNNFFSTTLNYLQDDFETTSVHLTPTMTKNDAFVSAEELTIPSLAYKIIEGEKSSNEFRVGSFQPATKQLTTEKIMFGTLSPATEPTTVLMPSESIKISETPDENKSTIQPEHNFEQSTHVIEGTTAHFTQMGTIFNMMPETADTKTASLAIDKFDNLETQKTRSDDQTQNYEYLTITPINIPNTLPTYKTEPFLIEKSLLSDISPTVEPSTVSVALNDEPIETTEHSVEHNSNKFQEFQSFFTAKDEITLTQSKSILEFLTENNKMVMINSSEIHEPKSNFTLISDQLDNTELNYLSTTYSPIVPQYDDSSTSKQEPGAKVITTTLKYDEIKFSVLYTMRDILKGTHVIEPTESKQLAADTTTSNYEREGESIFKKQKSVLNEEIGKTSMPITQSLEINDSKIGLKNEINGHIPATTSQYYIYKDSIPESLENSLGTVQTSEISFSDEPEPVTLKGFTKPVKTTIHLNGWFKTADGNRYSYATTEPTTSLNNNTVSDSSESKWKYKKTDKHTPDISSELLNHHLKGTEFTSISAAADKVVLPPTTKYTIDSTDQSIVLANNIKNNSSEFGTIKGVIETESYSNLVDSIKSEAVENIVNVPNVETTDLYSTEYMNVAHTTEESHWKRTNTALVTDSLLSGNPIRMMLQPATDANLKKTKSYKYTDNVSDASNIHESAVSNKIQSPTDVYPPNELILPTTAYLPQLLELSTVFTDSSEPTKDVEDAVLYVSTSIERPILLTSEPIFTPLISKSMETNTGNHGTTNFELPILSSLHFTHQVNTSTMSTNNADSIEDPFITEEEISATPNLSTLIVTESMDYSVEDKDTVIIFSTTKFPLLNPYRTSDNAANLYDDSPTVKPSTVSVSFSDEPIKTIENSVEHNYFIDQFITEKEILATPNSSTFIVTESINSTGENKEPVISRSTTEFSLLTPYTTSENASEIYDETTSAESTLNKYRPITVFFKPTPTSLKSIINEIESGDADENKITLEPILTTYVSTTLVTEPTHIVSNADESSTNIHTSTETLILTTVSDIGLPETLNQTSTEYKSTESIGNDEIITERTKDMPYLTSSMTANVTPNLYSSATLNSSNTTSNDTVSIVITPIEFPSTFDETENSILFSTKPLLDLPTLDIKESTTPSKYITVNIENNETYSTEPTEILFTSLNITQKLLTNLNENYTVTHSNTMTNNTVATATELIDFSNKVSISPTQSESITDNISKDRTVNKEEPEMHILANGSINLTEYLSTKLYSSITMPTKETDTGAYEFMNQTATDTQPHFSAGPPLGINPNLQKSNELTPSNVSNLLNNISNLGFDEIIKDSSNNNATTTETIMFTTESTTYTQSKLNEIENEDYVINKHTTENLAYTNIMNMMLTPVHNDVITTMSFSSNKTPKETVSTVAELTDILDKHAETVIVYEAPNGLYLKTSDDGGIIFTNEASETETMYETTTENLSLINSISADLATLGTEETIKTNYMPSLEQSIGDDTLFNTKTTIDVPTLELPQFITPYLITLPNNESTSRKKSVETSSTISELSSPSSNEILRTYETTSEFTLVSNKNPTKFLTLQNGELSTTSADSINNAFLSTDRIHDVTSQMATDSSMNSNLILSSFTYPTKSDIDGFISSYGPLIDSFDLISTVESTLHDEVDKVPNIISSTTENAFIVANSADPLYGFLETPNPSNITTESFLNIISEFDAPSPLTQEPTLSSPIIETVFTEKSIDFIKNNRNPNVYDSTIKNTNSIYETLKLSQDRPEFKLWSEKLDRESFSQAPNTHTFIKQPSTAVGRNGFPENVETLNNLDSTTVLASNGENSLYSLYDSNETTVGAERPLFDSTTEHKSTLLKDFESSSESFQHNLKDFEGTSESPILENNPFLKFLNLNSQPDNWMQTTQGFYTTNNTNLKEIAEPASTAASKANSDLSYVPVVTNELFLSKVTEQTPIDKDPIDPIHYITPDRTPFFTMNQVPETFSKSPVNYPPELTEQSLFKIKSSERKLRPEISFELTTIQSVQTEKPAKKTPTQEKILSTLSPINDYQNNIWPNIEDSIVEKSTYTTILSTNPLDTVMENLETPLIIWETHQYTTSPQLIQPSITDSDSLVFETSATLVPTQTERNLKSEKDTSTDIPAIRATTTIDDAILTKYIKDTTEDSYVKSTVPFNGISNNTNVSIVDVEMHNTMNQTYKRMNENSVFQSKILFNATQYTSSESLNNKDNITFLIQPSKNNLNVTKKGKVRNRNSSDLRLRVNKTMPHVKGRTQFKTESKNAIMNKLSNGTSSQRTKLEKAAPVRLTSPVSQPFSNDHPEHNLKIEKDWSRDIPVISTLSTIDGDLISMNNTTEEYNVKSTIPSISILDTINTTPPYNNFNTISKNNYTDNKPEIKNVNSVLQSTLLLNDTQYQALENSNDKDNITWEVLPTQNHLYDTKWANQVNISRAHSKGRSHSKIKSKHLTLHKLSNVTSPQGIKLEMPEPVRLNTQGSKPFSNDNPELHIKIEKDRTRDIPVISTSTIDSDLISMKDTIEKNNVKSILDSTTPPYNNSDIISKNNTNKQPGTKNDNSVSQSKYRGLQNSKDKIIKNNLYVTQGSNASSYGNRSDFRPHQVNTSRTRERPHLKTNSKNVTLHKLSNVTSPEGIKLEIAEPLRLIALGRNSEKRRKNLNATFVLGSPLEKRLKLNSPANITYLLKPIESNLSETTASTTTESYDSVTTSGILNYDKIEKLNNSFSGSLIEIIKTTVSSYTSENTISPLNTTVVNDENIPPFTVNANESQNTTEPSVYLNTGPVDIMKSEAAKFKTSTLRTNSSSILHSDPGHNRNGKNNTLTRKKPNSSSPRKIYTNTNSTLRMRSRKISPTPIKALEDDL